MQTPTGPFELGQVAAHMHHGLNAPQIALLVKRANGTSFSAQCVAENMEKLKKHPAHRGERRPGSARPRKTTKALDNKIIKHVLKNCGKEKVTVDSIRKRFPQLKKVGNTLIEERLHEAGLHWLRRPRKSRVAKIYKEGRIKFAEEVLRRQQSTLDRWMFSDGTVFYLDKAAADNEDSARLALGPFVWRASDNKKAMHEDLIGPSSYAKAQGYPVRVWGLLCCGKLHVDILPEDEVMDQFYYAQLIEEKFSTWMGPCTHLIQDFESCLRAPESMVAFEEAGIELVASYPRSSQDLNPIENVWNLLRQRVAQTRPQERELRDAFVVRLKSAVVWLNTHHAKALEKLTKSMKARAKDVIELEGGRTKW